MIIDVLGLGETINEFKPNSEHFTIGSNDIYKYFATDYLAVYDMKRAFAPERLKIIESSTPKKFYSYLKDWEQQPNFELMTINKEPRNNYENIHKEGVIACLTSSAICCQLAFKLGAKEINLYGVDLNNHKILSKPDRLLKIESAFKSLKRALNNHGVIIRCTKGSYLSKILNII